MKNRSPIGGKDVTPPIENSKTAKQSSARTPRMSSGEVAAAVAFLIGRLRTMDEIAPRPQAERVEALPLFPGWKAGEP